MQILVAGATERIGLRLINQLKSRGSHPVNPDGTTASVDVAAVLGDAVKNIYRTGKALLIQSVGRDQPTPNP